MNKTKIKNNFMYVVLFLLVLVAVCMMMTVHVQSHTQEKLLFDNSAYREAEEHYKIQVRQILETYGCYNSGLTMTHTVSLDGAREYDIQINHAKLDTLSAHEYAALKSEIEACRVVVSGMNSYFVEVAFLS